MKATIFVDRSRTSVPQYKMHAELDANVGIPALPDRGETIQLQDEDHPRFVRARTWKVTTDGLKVELYLGQQIRPE